MRRSARVLDICFAVPGAVISFPLVAALIAVVALETRASGLYRQVRVGRHAQPFTLYKVTSMKKQAASGTLAPTTVTTANDDRITSVGQYLRRFKLDELPQLWNVVAGDMSLVGPRPDVPGYADALTCDDRAVLDVRPGITGPASLIFKLEEDLLAASDDPEKFNDDVIWPTKVAVNVAYARHATLNDNLWLILMTFRSDSQRLRDMLGRWDPLLLNREIVRSLLDGSADDIAGPRTAVAQP